MEIARRLVKRRDPAYDWPSDDDPYIGRLFQDPNNALVWDVPPQF